MSRILLVEDDENLRFVIEQNLKKAGFTVFVAPDGEQAFSKLQTNEYDLCLLDVMLPKMDGFTVATKIRELKKTLPIIFLTARSLQGDKLKGLKIGGDDYITKPFDFEELILKIKVFLSRTSPNDQILSQESQQKVVFRYEDLYLKVGEFEKQLTPKEADILNIFMANPNTIIKREEILMKVWGDDDYFLGRSLDVFISKLRKYLKQEPGVDIQNYHGVGFKFSVDS